MSAPEISIVLPAFNCERFLGEAIDSLLQQTFQDFELLVINDGSTDNTESIILSYADPRIVYLENDGNKGLVYTLNKGLAKAKGRYIARMDADDICKPQRLEKQYNWLEQNDASVVACNVTFIDEDGLEIGEWKEDIQTTSADAIKEKMAWENCIAHPTVMMQAGIAKRYSYQCNQKNTEDYDLWLRLLADGIQIAKVPEKLLMYRVHDASVTGSILRKSNPYFKQYHCKRKFLAARVKLGKWGLFESKVLTTTIHNGIMGVGKNIKQLAKG